MVDRENVVAQENLETAPFRKFRNVLRAIVGNAKMFSGKGYGKHFYSVRKRMRKLRRGTRSMSLNLFQFYGKVEEIYYRIVKKEKKTV